MNRELNRRSFLKGGALLGAAALTGGALSACTPSNTGGGPDSPSTAGLPAGTEAADFEESLVVLEPITSFVDEKTYDGVVIGAGTAGVPAVYAALEEGATVACLQKAPAALANGNGSSGVILEESNEVGILQYMQNWRAAAGYRINYDLLKAFCAHSGETSNWMLVKSDEVGFPPVSASATTSTYDEGSFCTTVLKSYGPKPKNNTDIMVKLAEAAAKDGAEFFYETPAVQLVTDGSGAVTGVIAESTGGYVKFNATKAVIIAAGDYQSNNSLVARWSPGVVPFQRKQAARTGDGILLALSVGGVITPINHAKTMHDMDAGPMMLTFLPFMALNQKGKRFMNEEIPMESWDLALIRNTDVDDPGHFCRIFDNDFAAKYNMPMVSIESLENYIPGFKDDPQGVYTDLIDTHRADTLDELAKELDIPADALKSSVDAWNGYCAAGADSEFGVAKDKLKPIDTPPYWGTRQWIRCSAINSGVVVDEFYRVLDAANQPIKGLYSVGSGAGDICGGLEWNLAQGGLCCGSYMDMGRYAGIHAVTGGTTPAKPISYEEAKKYWAK
jgi:succinate dehydrogenase/fumarate reductase flavoprotein subunit